MSIRRQDETVDRFPPSAFRFRNGRSRVGGIDPNDPRVQLYREYLRILAVHRPAVFVMENVRGILASRREP